jgi:hypothetical protein
MMMTNQHVAEGREPSVFGDTGRLAPFREVGVWHLTARAVPLIGRVRWIMASA